MNGKTLVMEKEGDFYSIFLLHRGKKRKLKEKLTEDYAWTVLTAVWKKERDDWSISFVERAVKQKPTEKQRRILENARKLNILNVEVDKLNRVQATNIISFLFSKKQFEVTADLILREVVDETAIGKEYVYITDNLKLSADEVLCLVGAGCFFIVETEKKEYVSVRLKTLSSETKERALELAENRKNIEKLLKLPLPENVKEKLKEKLEEIDNNEILLPLL
jgi:hypothetical protein